MKIIPFNALATTDLVVGNVYEGSPDGSIAGEAIRNLLPGAGNQGGFRVSGRGEDKMFVVLYSSGRDPYWPDAIDADTGRFVYFGDNKTAGRELLNTPRGGNRLLQDLFKAARGKAEDRERIPPFFVFWKFHTPVSKRSARFMGLAVPSFYGVTSDEDLTVVIGRDSEDATFENYRAVFTILDVPTIERAWIDDLVGGIKDSVHAPSAWRAWRKTGDYRPMHFEHVDLSTMQNETPTSTVSPPKVTEPEQHYTMNEQRKETTKTSDGAWIASLGDQLHRESFRIAAIGDPMPEYLTRAGSWMAVADDARIAGLGRIYRVRQDQKATRYYFDRWQPLPDSDDEAWPIPDPNRIAPLATQELEKMAATVGVRLEDVPAIDDEPYIRDLFQAATVDDLLGPAGGPHEYIVDMGVRDRYLVGKLAPLTLGAAEGIEGLAGVTAVSQDEVSDDELEVHTGRHENGAGFASTTGRTDAEAESVDEFDATNNQSLVPSSVGLTFCIDADVTQIELEGSWGRYERLEDHDITKKRKNRETGEEEDIKARVWKRIPSGGRLTIRIATGPLKPIAIDHDVPDVVVRGSIRQPNANGDRLVTLFLVNNQLEPKENRDAAWVFQPELRVQAASESERRDIFRRRPLLSSDVEDPERISLEMIYRKRVEFAVGHGISVGATESPDDFERAIEVCTRVLPDYEIAVTDTPGSDERDRAAMQSMLTNGWLDMKQLAQLDRDVLIPALSTLTDDYAAWLDEQAARIGSEVVGYDVEAKDALKRGQDTLLRLREGISVLATDNDALEAFRFANLSMMQQRIHSLYALDKRRGGTRKIEDLKDPKNFTWRPFQLAFILLSIPSLANPLHPDRTKPEDAVADLLWFPTGGGKTEAYLGVAAFAMAIRRLKPDVGGLDGSHGLAVIMRYTLRLLTLQQFQRAASLICAMEVIRQGKKDGDRRIWGEHPFTLGLWVGNKVTPGYTEESHAAVEAFRNEGRRRPPASPAQLTSCPWCGAEIEPGRDIEVDRKLKRTTIYCGDQRSRCQFSRGRSSEQLHPGLPVVVVDEEIYHRPPSMMIATVDKFAMMAWRGQTRTLFGRATRECPRHGLIWPGSDCSGRHPAERQMAATEPKQISPLRPPDLIIQDEFHLISGPLGTLVGLYETVVDHLCEWSLGEARIHPKIVASSATVRKASEQVRHVFLRNVSIFPPHGLDVEDNYFSVQRDIAERAGRRYLGICSPGSSRPAVLIRVYTALLTAAQGLFERFGSAADPYMTTVGYFNSLRELGGMKRLAEDDVQTRSYRVQMSLVNRPGLAQRALRPGGVLELTSRISSQDIPKNLDQLEIPFRADLDPATGKYFSDWQKGEDRAVDVVLATNMLSVGVDVGRLGVMAVNGQPKGTAEYIQATSRVGRAHPGLVCTVLTWARPRDLSHYETFEHYHATFYKHVEAQSVTPFSPRAMDRGLTGTMVSLLRLDHDPYNPNDGAGSLDDVNDGDAQEAHDVLLDRAWKVTGRTATKDLASDMIKARVDQWVKEASMGGRTLAYELRGQTQGTTYPLLKKPGIESWGNFTVPMSMREVEPGVRLIMNSSKSMDAPSWRVAPPRPAAATAADPSNGDLAFGDALLAARSPGAVFDVMIPGEPTVAHMQFIQTPSAKPSGDAMCLVLHPSLKQSGSVPGVAYGRISVSMLQSAEDQSPMVNIKIRGGPGPASLTIGESDWEAFDAIAIRTMPEG